MVSQCPVRYLAGRKRLRTGDFHHVCVLRPELIQHVTAAAFAGRAAATGCFNFGVQRGNTILPRHYRCPFSHHGAAPKVTLSAIRLAVAGGSSPTTVISALLPLSLDRTTASAAIAVANWFIGSVTLMESYQAIGKEAGFTGRQVREADGVFRPSFILLAQPASS